MSKTKGGPGSGRKPGGGTRLPPVRVPSRIGPAKPMRSGVRPSELFPYGRHPDGTPRTANDIRDPNKPPKS